VFGVVMAAVLLSTSNGGGIMMSDEPDTPEDFIEEASSVSYDREAVDINTLLTAARGAPPMICSLAAQAVRGWGWGDWSDAPVTPLGKTVTLRDTDSNTRTLSDADVQLLLASLGSDDACVREIGVRIIGRKGNPRIASGLIERLSASSSTLREIAALGLGLAEPREAVDPLIRALRDSEVGVRANSAWALGHSENGRAGRLR
jgi:hypothetical protein